jgi:hypothetical protein
MEMPVGGDGSGGEDGEGGGYGKTDGLSQAHDREEGVAVVRNYGEQVGHWRNGLL